MPSNYQSWGRALCAAVCAAMLPLGAQMAFAQEDPGSEAAENQPQAPNQENVDQDVQQQQDAQQQDAQQQQETQQPDAQPAEQADRDLAELRRRMNELQRDMQQMFPNDAELEALNRRFEAWQEQLPRQREFARGQEAGDAWLGVVLDAADTPQAQERAGARIREVFPDGPAAQAGLRVGDVIASINDEVVEDQRRVVEQVGEMEPGDEVGLVVLRDGQRQEVNVTLGQRRDFVGQAPGLPEQFRGFGPRVPGDMEFNRRADAQNQRLENLVLELLDEVRDLKQEVRTMREGESARQEPGAPPEPVEADEGAALDEPDVETEVETPSEGN